jgi:hypothetical protein
VRGEERATRSEDSALAVERDGEPLTVDGVHWYPPIRYNVR